MSYENVVLNQDNNFYLMSLIILITYICWNVCGYYREKLRVNHFWEY